MATQQVTQTQYWERPLSPLEIRDRTKHLIEMLADHETVVGKIDEHKRHVRDHDTQKKRLEFQIGTTRREIQRGYVYETRQVKLELDRFEGEEYRARVDSTGISDIAPGTLADEQGNPVEDPRPWAKEPAPFLEVDDAPSQDSLPVEALGEVEETLDVVPPQHGGDIAKPAKKKRSARKKAAGK